LPRTTPKVDLGAPGAIGLHPTTVEPTVSGRCHTAVRPLSRTPASGSASSDSVPPLKESTVEASRNATRVSLLWPGDSTAKISTAG
jgi:hypothetical protein